MGYKYFVIILQIIIHKKEYIHPSVNEIQSARKAL